MNAALQATEISLGDIGIFCKIMHLAPDGFGAYRDLISAPLLRTRTETALELLSEGVLEVLSFLQVDELLTTGVGEPGIGRKATL
jgi:hypothetical protein